MDAKKIALLNEKIRQISHLLEELKETQADFPMIRQNAKRALASVKMMELGVCDPADLD